MVFVNKQLTFRKQQTIENMFLIARANLITFMLSIKIVSLHSQFNYSNSSNNRTASNKSIHRCNFGLLLHKIARFWPILAHFCHKINNRTGTIIKRTRVGSLHVNF